VNQELKTYTIPVRITEPMLMAALALNDETLCDIEDKNGRGRGVRDYIEDIIETSLSQRFEAVFREKIGLAYQNAQAKLRRCYRRRIQRNVVKAA